MALEEQVEATMEGNKGHDRFLDLSYGRQIQYENAETSMMRVLLTSVVQLAPSSHRMQGWMVENAAG